MVANGAPIQRGAEKNKTVTLPNDPKKDGFTFTEWNTQSDGKGSAFTASTKVTKDVTLYPQWKENPKTNTSQTTKADGGDKTEENGSGKPSTLTITGLPQGRYDLLVVGADTKLLTLTNCANAGFGFEAFGSLSSGNVFELLIQGGDTWTGTGKRQVILTNKDYNKDDPLDKNNPMYRTATVTFTNGGATVKYSSFTAVTKR